MQILLLLTDLFDVTGGIQTFNRCLVKALDDLSVKHDISIKIVVLSDTGKSSLIQKYISSQNIEYIFCKRNKFKFFTQALKYSINSNEIIFGHINFSPIALFASILNPNAKKYQIVHGIDVWKKLPLLKQLGIKKINKILSISSYTKSQMKNYNNIAENKFTIFLNTLDPFYAKERSDRNIVLPEGRIILSVTRLHPKERYKNIELVIRALPEVLKGIPDAFYVIVGEGTDRLRLELLAKELGVRDNVIFTGYVVADLLPLYYESSDIFVLPSTGEGFGIVFLEAMYYGKLCIGANAGGVPEVVENGKTGILVNPDNVTDLSSAIVKSLTDKSLSVSMGKEGKERFNNEFSFEAFRNRLEEIILA